MKTDFLLVGFLSFVFCSQSFGQCDWKVQFSVKTENGRNSIFIGLEKGTSVFDIELYDLLQGKVVMRARSQNLTNERKAIFKSVPNSRYVVFIRKEGCDKPLQVGGIEGFEVGT